MRDVDAAQEGDLTAELLLDGADDPARRPGDLGGARRDRPSSRAVADPEGIAPVLHLPELRSGASPGRERRG